MPKFVVFRRHFDKKHTSMLQSFILSTLPAVKFVAQSISNGINILAGDDPVPIKFGPKGTGRMHMSHFTRGALCNRRCRPCVIFCASSVPLDLLSDLYFRTKSDLFCIVCLLLHICSEMFTLPNKTGCEVIMHFLFTCLDPAYCHEHFRLVFAPQVYLYCCI